MGHKQKILTTVLWGTLVLMMLAVISFRSLAADELPVLFRGPAFSLTDQDGKTVTDKTLAGQVWVVDFIFTHCAGPCPMMTAKLAEFQKRVRNPSVKMVSVSVDPDRDTPEVLKAYAKKFNADESRWHFLTGKKSDIFDFAAGMKLTAKPADPESDIRHDERFLLVDQHGDIRGVYHSKDAESMSKLATDAEALAAGGRRP